MEDIAHLLTITWYHKQKLNSGWKIKKTVKGIHINVRYNSETKHTGVGLDCMMAWVLDSELSCVGVSHYTVCVAITSY